MDPKTANNDILSEQPEVESERTADEQSEQAPRRADFAVVRVNVKTGIKAGGIDTSPS
jgi:hypothetical protein